MEESPDNKYIPMTSFASGKGIEFAPYAYYYTNQIVNLVFVGIEGTEKWVLVDAGMPRSGEEIFKVARDRFGEGSRPEAIILTHGHFDHVGGLVYLLEKWKVPVYAHQEEFPYLTGIKKYPEPDTTVEGGLLAKISSIYPVEPVDVSEYLQPLPDDNTVPVLPGWKWVHVPGHSPGQVAYFRDSDRLLVAGDAFVTVRQDSFYKVLIQEKEINGPPRYLTTDWKKAWESVRVLNALQPEIAVTGHGPYMEGEELKTELAQLAEEFDLVAIPQHGRYVK